MNIGPPLSPPEDTVLSPLLFVFFSEWLFKWRTLTNFADDSVILIQCKNEGDFFEKIWPILQVNRKMVEQMKNECEGLQDRIEGFDLAFHTLMNWLQYL